MDYQIIINAINDWNPNQALKKLTKEELETFSPKELDNILGYNDKLAISLNASDVSRDTFNSRLSDNANESTNNRIRDNNYRFNEFIKKNNLTNDRIKNLEEKYKGVIKIVPIGYTRGQTNDSSLLDTKKITETFFKQAMLSEKITPSSKNYKAIKAELTNQQDNDYYKNQIKRWFNLYQISCKPELLKTALENSKTEIFSEKDNKARKDILEMISQSPNSEAKLKAFNEVREKLEKPIVMKMAEDSWAQNVPDYQKDPTELKQEHKLALNEGKPIKYLDEIGFEDNINMKK
jgi:hypothetical protein